METVILPKKGYSIPKYLYKRKIEIIRWKIIRRKYAYLFYRRTISQILPSQATQHYLSNLKQHLLKRWVSYWYHERVEWKLIIRAEIHFNLTLTHHALRRMIHFVVLQKTTRLKEMIADAHFGKNQRKQLYHFVFCKWKWYVKYRLHRKSKNKQSVDFFKAKYCQKISQIFIEKWRVYTKVSKRKKQRMQDAHDNYNHKLLLKTYNELKLYANKNKTKHNIIKKLREMYEKKLLQRLIIFWRKFTVDSLNEKQNIILANQHYILMLKRHVLQQILLNKIKNLEMKAKLLTLKNRQDLRMKEYYFNVFRVHHLNKKNQLYKTSAANKHAKYKMKMLMLNHWKLYHRLCLDEKLKLAKRLCDFQYHIMSNKIKHVFKIWHIFTEHKKSKKFNLARAESFSRNILMNKFFNHWKQFLSHKQFKKYKIKTSEQFYMSKYITKWKEFTVQEIKFKEYLQKANEFYRHSLVKQGLMLIARSGIAGKEQNFQHSLAKLAHQLFLAHKYFSKWKQNVIFQLIRDPEKTSPRLMEFPQIANIKWYPICFIAPIISENE